MLNKIKHLTYHSRVIKKRSKLIPKIAKGYFNTLVLKKTVLRTIELALLTECNSKCEMCYASKMKKNNDQYLSVSEYEKIWKQADRLGAFSVILSGGEPTLHKDFFDIVSVLDPKNSIIALVTNSLNLNEHFLKEAKKLGIETLHLSLDGTDPKINDKVRGTQGHFQKVMESIETAKKAGIAVYISTVVAHNGLDKMKEMVKFTKEKNIGIVFSLACVSGNWANSKDVLLTPEEWQEVQTYMRANPCIRSDWTINFSLKTECPGGREKLNISPYGDITGCGMNYVSFGNIRQEPLEIIWKRMGQFPAFKKRSKDCLIGADKNYIEKYIKPLSDMTVPVQIDKHPKNPIPLKDLD